MTLELIEGRDETPEVSLPRPTHSAPVVEPHYGTTIELAGSLADVGTDPNGGRPTFVRNYYSRIQAFNADSSRYFLAGSTGFFYLFDADTNQFLRVLTGLAGDPEPQWDSTDPHKLWYMPNSGIGMKLYSLNVETLQTTLEADFGPAVRAIWPTASLASTKGKLAKVSGTKFKAALNADNVALLSPQASAAALAELAPTRAIATDQRSYAPVDAYQFAALNAAGAMAVWTKSEGSPSSDMRYWGLMVDADDWSSLGVICWDQVEQRIVGYIETHGDRPDHVSMTPDGGYIVPSWDSVKGTRAYERDFSLFVQLHHKSEHSDLGLLPSGDPFYASIDYQSNSGDVFFVDITAAPHYQPGATNVPDAPRTVLFPSYNDGAGRSGAGCACHFSAKAYDKPGWVSIATYNCGPYYDGSKPWYWDKLCAVELSDAARILNIANLHSSNPAGGYNNEPQAVVNRDFTRIQFNSNWGTSGDANVQPFQIALPAEAVGVPADPGDDPPGDTDPPNDDPPGDTEPPVTASRVQFTRKGRWQVAGGSAHNDLTEAFEEAANLALMTGSNVVVTPPGYVVAPVK